MSEMHMKATYIPNWSASLQGDKGATKSRAEKQTHKVIDRKIALIGILQKQLSQLSLISFYKLRLPGIGDKVFFRLSPA